MRIIGITGLANSGKDTVCNYINSNYGGKRIAFGDAVKEAALTLPFYVYTHVQYNKIVTLQDYVDEFGWDVCKRASSHVREILQKVGTELGRNFFGEDCWVNIAIKKLDYDNLNVFSDVRFSNEVTTVGSNNLIEIVRPFLKKNMDHASEQLKLSFPHPVIVNDGSLQDLYDKVDQVLDTLGYVKIK